MYDVYKGYLRQYTKQENSTERGVKDWVSKHTWKKERVFKLVQHGNDGGPCMSVEGHNAGKLCVFPFVHPDCNIYPKPPACEMERDITPVVHTECVKEVGSGEWCSIKTHWNDSHITGKFGTCSPQCRDHRNHTDILSSTDLWKEMIFSLLSVDGYCHTYNPRHQSSAAHEEQFISLLGKL